MRKHLVLSVAAALLVASAAWAAEETGTITSVDPSANTFTIQTEDGERIVFRAEASTRMTRDGSTVQLSDLEVGNRVQVTAEEAEGAAQRMATEVELVSSAGEAGARGEAGMQAGESGAGAGVGASAEVGDTRMGGEAGVGARAGEGGMGAQAQADVDIDTDDDDARMARADRLPGTASPLPLIGLLGAGSVALGLLVRRIRR